MPTTTDDLLAKGMTAEKGLKATIKGFHGVFKTLTEQHGEVSAMLRRAKDDEEKLEELWPKIRSELLSHERAELSVVYPELRLYEETRGFADQHEQEAGQLEDAIGRVDSATKSESSLMFLNLVKLVEAHVNLEEGTIFPKANDVIEKDRAEQLDREFLAAKKAVVDSTLH